MESIKKIIKKILITESYQQEIIDLILDKVSKYGEKSLLPHEKSLLDRISSEKLNLKNDEELIYDFLNFNLGKLKPKSYHEDRLGKQVSGIQYFDKNNEYIFDFQLESEVLGIKKEINYLIADDGLYELIISNFTISDEDAIEVIKRWFEKESGFKVTKIDFWISEK